MTRRRKAIAGGIALVMALFTACASAPEPGSAGSPAGPTDDTSASSTATSPETSNAGPSKRFTASPSETSTATTPESPRASPSETSTAGWRVTVYYTPVEEFHGGDPVAVRGHPSLTSETETDLGSYPAEFVAAVRDEGGGRISSGENAGRYLNWSSHTGFWLDTSTRDTAGEPLIAFETAAVDNVPRGTTLHITACGMNDDGSPADAGPCEKLREATWVVRDEFTPGLGGDRHADLYLGEQDGPDFTNSALWVSWTDARVTLAPRG